MTPDARRRIEALYHEALERRADERGTFLEEACAGDHALRREVESLLRERATGDGVPATVAAGPLSSFGGVETEPDAPHPQGEGGNAPSIPGSRLGAYRIDSLLGKGGMGEVYRARDTRLGRDVAVKMLPRAFTNDPEWLARFEREARLLAALNHPNIAILHGLEERDGVRALVMELVEGETLAERIAGAQGARSAPAGIPVQEAIQIGRQIAEGLDAAHEKRIVHRDLKPANIKVTPAGIIKILDFGLAKLDPGVASADATITVGSTREGVVLGTPAYMSPEQARGKAVDKRTDIWAFGCVLFEALAGRAVFARETFSDTIAALLEGDPDWSALPGGTPDRLRRLLERCLERDPRKRLRDIGDAILDLTAAVSDADRRPLPPADLRLAPGEVRGMAGSFAAPGSRSITPLARTPLPRPLLLEQPAGEFVFVGRERECAQLGEAWTRAKEGRRQLLLLAGEPGIGKTRLLLEFARTCADEHGTVLVGRCDEETLVPYQPFVEALGWYARVCPDADLHAALAEAGGGGELGPFIADFLARVPGLVPPTPMDAQGQRYRLFETVNALLGAASKAFPILLIIDDLHWADKATLSLLRHIVRGSDPARLCIAGTYRESEFGPAHQLAELLADLRRERDVTRLSLTGLGPSQVGKLVETLASPDVSSMLAGTMTDNTGGNPFFVGEILRHLHETGALAELRGVGPGQRAGRALGLPQGVREVISRRVSRLSEPCSRAMTLASVLGLEFDLDVLEDFGDFSEDELLDAVDEACRAQLIDEVPGRVGRHRFHHALIRDTLYGDLAASRRLRLHRRAGEVLERMTGGQTGPRLADLAHHFVHAAPSGVADKAVDYAMRAGDRMADALAYEEAARFYDLALVALDSVPEGTAVGPQRVTLQRRLGRAFSNLGQWAQQKAALEKALTHLGTDAAEERCEILSELSQAYFWLFDIPALERVATEVLSLAERAGREDLAANSMGWLARCRHARGDTSPESIEADRVTIARFGSAARISYSFGPLALYWVGRGTAAVAVAAQAVQMAETSHDTTFTMNALSHYALNLAGVGRYGEALGVFARAQEFGRKYGVLPLLARATSISAGIPLALGDLDGAESIQCEARELAQRVNFTPSIISPCIDLLLIAARRGEPGRVEKLFEETVAASQRTPGWHGWLWELRICQVRAELWLARGAWETARLEATECIRQSRTYRRQKYEALGLATRARALDRLGRTEEAIVDARLAVAVARKIEDPALLLQALDLVIQMDGDDSLAAEARDTHRRILDAIPESDLRRRFAAGEVARRIQKL
jgi:serine/threonine protein kinase/tetratricopeptide (TPR) repeat protein